MIIKLALLSILFLFLSLYLHPPLFRLLPSFLFQADEQAIPNNKIIPRNSLITFIFNYNSQGHVTKARTMQHKVKCGFGSLTIN